MNKWKVSDNRDRNRRNLLMNSVHASDHLRSTVSENEPDVTLIASICFRPTHCDCTLPQYSPRVKPLSIMQTPSKHILIFLSSIFLLCFFCFPPPVNKVWVSNVTVYFLTKLAKHIWRQWLKHSLKVDKNLCWRADTCSDGNDKKRF